jgi:Protein of unknown function (DUF3108)
MPRCAAAFLSIVVLASAAAAADTPETLRYHWNLGGFLGTLARVFLPGRGEGSLTTRCNDAGRVEVELDITAPGTAEEGEYWRYGAEFEAATNRTLRAWSSYRFRGDNAHQESDLEDAAVIDVASGILLLRRDPPTKPRDLRIWNDGKIYPVVIIPQGQEQRSVGGRQMIARHFAIRPRRLPNERVWKGSMDIYLLNDEASTPVEISVERRMARVRLVLEDGA